MARTESLETRSLEVRVFVSNDISCSERVSLSATEAEQDATAGSSHHAEDTEAVPVDHDQAMPAAQAESKVRYNDDMYHASASPYAFEAQRVFRLHFHHPRGSLSHRSSVNTLRKGDPLSQVRARD